LKFFIGADGNSFSESGIRTGGIVIFIAQFCVFLQIKPISNSSCTSLGISGKVLSDGFFVLEPKRQMNLLIV
jgi:hypothetical protein